MLGLGETAEQQDLAVLEERWLGGCLQEHSGTMATAELPLVTAMGLDRGCTALFAPLLGSCCDVFILILGCLNGCSLCCKVHMRSYRSQAIRSDGLAIVPTVLLGAAYAVGVQRPCKVQRIPGWLQILLAS